jgi:hypothetical protein
MKITFLKPSTALTNSALFFFCFLVFNKTSAQEITAKQLLEKAIHYHDPMGNWDHFKGTLSVNMNLPNGNERLSEISIDLGNQYFKLQTIKDDKNIEYVIANSEVTFSLDNTTEFTEEEAKNFNLTDTRAKFMQNYYTYLYGLPMKLKDPGTLIKSAVERKEFLGKTYLVLKVKYEEGVGKDSWYFYFDPKTYALKVCQFYHDETKNDGEYILLSEEAIFSGIKIPKIRAWYMNKDRSYLATDTLTKISNL